MPTLQQIRQVIAANDDPANALAVLAKSNGWTPTDLWNMYDNNKHKFTKKEQQAMYVVTGRACAILYGFYK
jgi:hypothetical protein